MIFTANIPKNNTVLIAFGTRDIGPYYWVGRSESGVQYYAGQTFQAPATGQLKHIQLFAPVVHRPSGATLGIYQFDNTTNTFGKKLSEITKEITKGDENKWIDFTIADLKVEKNQFYAFKINSIDLGMFAIAECPWSAADPYVEGIQWTGTSTNPHGLFHKDFDFAFQGAIEASADTQFI